jgi:hypothetical protein
MGRARSEVVQEDPDLMATAYDVSPWSEEELDLLASEVDAMLDHVPPAGVQNRDARTPSSL